MNKEKWQVEADGLIDSILDNKEKIKRLQEDLDSEKDSLVRILRDNNKDEYTGPNGKANFVTFEREGLVKDNVVDAVNGVNKGKITQINMNDLTKDIQVCFINVKGVV